MRLDPEQLNSLGRDVSGPFEVALADGICTVTEILRLLPGRRLAARGRFAEKNVLIKLFFGKGARRACKRDRRGAEVLQSIEVATPALLQETVTLPAGGHALLYEFLERARPIGTGGSADAENHAALAVEALACLHERGAVHRDANLDNCMVCDDRLFLVDGAAVRLMPAGLNEAASLKALAAFLAEYPPAQDQRVPALLARYADQRGWPARAARRSRLAAQLQAARRRRVCRYLAKSERDCTEFLRRRGWRQVCLARRDRWTPALASFAQCPEAHLAHAELIKNGRSASVFRLSLDGAPLVVKRYNIKSPLHRVRRWFKHRSRIAWRNGHRLALLGIPGAEPVALVERRWGPLRAESWLVMPDCGTLDLLSEVQARGWSEAVLDSATRIFLDLRRAGLCHGDTKASNFLVQDGEVRLVDLDGLRERPGSGLDVARFLENFEGSALAQVRARFAAAGLIEQDA